MARQKKPPIIITYGKGPKIAPGQNVGQAGLGLTPPVFPGTPLDSNLWVRLGVWASVISSRCSAIMYQDQGRNIGSLFITFRDGTTCQYDNVPQNMAEDLFNASSCGAFVTQRLKGWVYKIV